MRIEEQQSLNDHDWFIDLWFIKWNMNVWTISRRWLRLTTHRTIYKPTYRHQKRANTIYAQVLYYNHLNLLCSASDRQHLPLYQREFDYPILHDILIGMGACSHKLLMTKLPIFFFIKLNFLKYFWWELIFNDWTHALYIAMNYDFKKENIWRDICRRDSVRWWSGEQASRTWI